MNKMKKRLNAMMWLALAVIGLAIYLLVSSSTQHISASITESCPAGTVKKGYIFSQGQETLECVKSGYYAFERHSPVVFFGILTVMTLFFAALIGLRGHVFRADNARLRIRAKQ